MYEMALEALKSLGKCAKAELHSGKQCTNSSYPADSVVSSRTSSHRMLWNSRRKGVIDAVPVVSRDAPHAACP